jgi:hypothetical protein
MAFIPLALVFFAVNGLYRFLMHLQRKGILCLALLAIATGNVEAKGHNGSKASSKVSFTYSYSGITYTYTPPSPAMHVKTSPPLASGQPANHYPKPAASNIFHAGAPR